MYHRAERDLDGKAKARMKKRRSLEIVTEKRDDELLGTDGR
jgi:hypothetical protein